MIERENLCRKGQAFSRQSNSLERRAHTTLTVWLRQSHVTSEPTSLEVKKKIESIAVRVTLKRRIALSITEWLWEWIGSFVIRAEHGADINAPFCPPRQWRGDICSIHIYSATKEHVPQATSRREDIDGVDRCSVDRSQTLESGIYSTVIHQNCVLHAPSSGF